MKTCGYQKAASCELPSLNVFMNYKQRFSLIAFLFLLLSCESTSPYDIIIVNGTVYDGSGSAPQKADIGIRGEHIVRIGDLSKESSAVRIDASNLVVAPGFIDLHTHLDAIEKFPACENLVRQGITTALGGPDGGGPWPFGPYLDSLSNRGVGMNVGFMVGHNVIRKNVLQLSNREPTVQELERMKSQVSQAMTQGAFGISTGLKYLPGAFSKTPEIIELSRIVALAGGFYTSHLRDEGLQILESVQEAIAISAQADIPIVLTHHKIVGKPMWGSSKKTLAMVDSARKAGLDVMLDQYPYTASRTVIGILIPAWAMEGGKEKFRARIADPNLYDSIQKQVISNLLNDRGGADLKKVTLSYVSWDTTLNEKTLYDWCLIEKLQPTMANAAGLVLKAHSRGDTRCIFHAMDEDDVKRIMQHPYTAVATDGVLSEPGYAPAHPRAYGTFPRVLSKYVRQEGVLSMENAIRKMTSLPASRMGLTDRGLLKENYKADIVVFDPEKIEDKSTFASPLQYPEGINYVLINGKVTLENGVLNKVTPGKVLRGPMRK
jgi:dihydroorotase/N-acyl-D-amino-acid deacylase